MAAAGFSSEWSPARRALGAGCQQPAKAAKERAGRPTRPEYVGAASRRLQRAPLGTWEAAPRCPARARADEWPEALAAKSENH